MSALAITLLGLAAWLAERGSRSVRRGHLGLGDLAPPARRSGVAAPPGWAIWASIGAAIGFIASGLASTIGALPWVWSCGSSASVAAPEPPPPSSTNSWSMRSRRSPPRSGRAVPCHRRSRSPRPRRDPRCATRCARSIDPSARRAPR